MNQCVPNWDLDDNPLPARLSARSNSNSAPPDVPILDYEVAELTWENGQLAMHGLGQPRVSLKPQPQQPASTNNNKYTWDKLPRGTGTGTGTGTLESIVDQAAAALPNRKRPPQPPPFDDVVPWFNCPGAATSASMTMDALVPCTAAATDRQHQKHQEQGIAGTMPLLNESSTVPPMCAVGCSTRLDSCSEAAVAAALQADDARKRARVAAAVQVPVAREWSGRDQYSASGSATMRREMDSQQMTVDTCDRDVCVGLTSTSMGSQDTTSSGARPCTQATATADEHDSICHGRSQASLFLLLWSHHEIVEYISSMITFVFGLITQKNTTFPLNFKK
ncbi:hypothetical protein CRG98_037585 [Punica granatum]|uniref:Uncharacterized protein n=1 Tax=Punica granatum TaxID=22663 RepID=A0A2I0IE01_PUNGR|nr:hypothetical protein CRG98_037585 [Punica granatum]